jgi:hypothetical protein
VDFNKPDQGLPFLSAVGRAVIHNILIPSNASQLCVCYLIWTLLFVGVNIIWDIRSNFTPKFHFLSIQSKSSLLHPAAAMCSCVLVIAALINDSIKDISAETAIPIVLSSLSGIFQAIGSLCPYKLPPPAPP